MQQVNRSGVLLWDVCVTVDPTTKQIVYDVRASVTKSVQIIYDVLQQGPISVTKQVQILFNTLKTMSTASEGLGASGFVEHQVVPHATATSGSGGIDASSTHR
jgi:hypothetical protein